MKRDNDKELKLLDLPALWRERIQCLEEIDDIDSAGWVGQCLLELEQAMGLPLSEGSGTRLATPEEVEAELGPTCSPEEAERRVRWAEEWLDEHARAVLRACGLPEDRRGE